MLEKCGTVTKISQPAKQYGTSSGQFIGWERSNNTTTSTDITWKLSRMSNSVLMLYNYQVKLYIEQL